MKETTIWDEPISDTCAARRFVSISDAPNTSNTLRNAGMFHTTRYAFLEWLAALHQTACVQSQL